jgi:hypothetical protein
MDYKNKYLKYKNKYLSLKNTNNLMTGGDINTDLHIDVYNCVIENYNMQISTNFEYIIKCIKFGKIEDKDILSELKKRENYSNFILILCQIKVVKSEEKINIFRETNETQTIITIDYFNEIINLIINNYCPLNDTDKMHELALKQMINVYLNNYTNKIFKNLNLYIINIIKIDWCLHILLSSTYNYNTTIIPNYIISDTATYNIPEISYTDQDKINYNVIFNYLVNTEIFKSLINTNINIQNFKNNYNFIFIFTNNFKRYNNFFSNNFNKDNIHTIETTFLIFYDNFLNIVLNFIPNKEEEKDYNILIDKFVNIISCSNDYIKTCSNKFIINTSIIINNNIHNHKYYLFIIKIIKKLYNNEILIANNDDFSIFYSKLYNEKSNINEFLCYILNNIYKSYTFDYSSIKYYNTTSYNITSFISLTQTITNILKIYRFIESDDFKIVLIDDNYKNSLLYFKNMITYLLYNIICCIINECINNKKITYDFYHIENIIYLLSLFYRKIDNITNDKYQIIMINNTKQLVNRLVDINKNINIFNKHFDRIMLPHGKSNKNDNIVNFVKFITNNKIIIENAESNTVDKPIDKPNTLLSTFKSFF